MRQLRLASGVLTAPDDRLLEAAQAEIDRLAGVARAESDQRIRLHKALELVCEKAVVDWDDPTVGLVNQAVGPETTYGDWLRETLTRANQRELLANLPIPNPRTPHDQAPPASGG